MLDTDTGEIASFVVTGIGLPVTIATFVYQGWCQLVAESGHL